MTKELNKQSFNYIKFEMARLRTRWDNEIDKDIRNKIAKRYLRIAEEFSRRSDNWFWTPHVLDRVIGKVEEKLEHHGKEKCKRCS